MADVTLVLENSDRLLPVDYGQVELGRRLFRSGENEYMLNRQRIRLRDLIDLLDEGNLADNAFLFIGQGMVDQALALRPEERRPLFEEAAGVRRHERRRRQAECRVGRGGGQPRAPARRAGRAAPAGAPAGRPGRAAAGAAVGRARPGRALVAAARVRWHELDAAAKTDQAALAAAHAEADDALADLRAAEDEGQRLSRGLAERAETEVAQRSLVDAQRAKTVELRLALARTRSDQAGRGARQAAHRRRAPGAGRAGGVAEQELARPQSSIDDSLAGEVERLSAEIEQLRGGRGQAPGASINNASDLAALERRRASVGAQIAELRRQAPPMMRRPARPRRDTRPKHHAAEAARKRFGEADETAQSSRSALDAAAADEARLSRLATDAEAVLKRTARPPRFGRAGLDAASHAALGRAVRAAAAHWRPRASRPIRPCATPSRPPSATPRRPG